MRVALILILVSLVQVSLADTDGITKVERRAVHGLKLKVTDTFDLETYDAHCIVPARSTYENPITSAQICERGQVFVMGGYEADAQSFAEGLLTLAIFKANTLLSHSNGCFFQLYGKGWTPENQISERRTFEVTEYLHVVRENSQTVAYQLDSPNLYGRAQLVCYTNNMQVPRAAIMTLGAGTHFEFIRE